MHSHRERMVSLSRVALLFSFLSLSCVHGFAVLPEGSSRTVCLAAKEDLPEGAEGRGGGSDESTVDWDAEWKKVVSNRDQPTERPGKNYYKSDAEIAAIRAANQLQETTMEATKKISVEVPSWNSVKSDPKFWIGIIAAVSVGLSLVSGAAMQSATNVSPDSYYI